MHVNQRQAGQFLTTHSLRPVLAPVVLLALTTGRTTAIAGKINHFTIVVEE